VIAVNPPLLLRERRRRASRTSRWLRLYHDDRRVLLHRHDHVDRAGIAEANAEIGNASWMHPFSDIFGNLNAALHHMPYHMARILKFPERRSEIARLKAEIKELRKTVRGGCC